MKSWGSSLLNAIKTSKHYHLKSAFTIVELLVVIVVIGVLAAITVVSYNGITKRATLASLQSDLANAATKLKSYQTIYGSYPTLDANNCPNAPTIDNNYCLKFSPGNSIAIAPFAGYIPNNSTTPQTFSLTLSSNDIQGIITESSKPSILTPAPLDPVADWIATPQGDHYGNYYDPVSKSWANVTRSTPKTIYDPTTQHIYDIPANKLGIRPRSDGKNGYEAEVEEARTNYLLNSSFTTDTNLDGMGDNWYSSGNTVESVKFTIESDSVYGRSQRMQYTGKSGDVNSWRNLAQTTAAGTFAPGDNVNLSGYLKGSANGITIKHIMRCYDASGVYLTGVGSSTITLADKWEKYSFSWSNLPANTSRVQGEFISINSIDINDNFDIYTSAVQLEKGIFDTSYIPTTTTTVARNSDSITIPTNHWNASEGTVFTDAGLPASTSVYSRQFGWYRDGSNRLGIGWQLSTNKPYIYSVSSGAISTATASLAPVGPFISANVWLSGSAHLEYLDGVVASNTTGIYISISGLPDNAFIGQQGDGTFYYNGPISRIIAYPSALSNDNVTTITDTIKKDS